MKERLNSSLDDVCAEIGYTATRKLQAWFHARNLYVPRRFDNEHPLAVLLGPAAFKALVKAFGGTTLWVPNIAEDVRYLAYRSMAERIAQGDSSKKLAKKFNLTIEQCCRLRAQLERLGWVSYAEASPVMPAMAGRNARLQGQLEEFFGNREGFPIPPLEEDEVAAR